MEPSTTVPPPPPPDPSSTLLDPTPPRRRLKRKSNGNNSNSNPSSSSNKRREKSLNNNLSSSSLSGLLLSQIQFNGPCTRAAAASASSSAGALLDVEEAEKVKELGLNDVKEEEEKVRRNEYWEKLEKEIEREYEGKIRSRERNVHVVPNHCGWFSWTSVHALEEQTLTSFFNGRSEERTPSVYMEIRNWIMRKFHADPNTQIELKDLEELTVGDLESRQEVMEFLDYWGLINFHPFPPKETDSAAISSDVADKTDSLTEKLYCFEKVQWCPQVVQRTNTVTPAIPSRLLPEPAIAEELVKPDEGPAYHCNSCSADCSRKRYHCQTQADFDLCTECFSNGKFGSEMSSSDFILMEPADALGVSGGKWTDQETLLLLEALELFKENWNEIAEHVATKTKAQCILHFVQMPIEDSFLDCDDESEASLLENTDPASTNNDSSAPKEAPEETENKSSVTEDEPPSLPLEKSKSEKVDEVKACSNSGENCAVKALREAFEAVGSVSMPGVPIRFSEAGNPVMALAAFLARLVEPDAATASARSSLKSISGTSPSMQLAARHCFVLEDPQDEKKGAAESRRDSAEMVDQDAQNDEKMQAGNQKEEKSSSVSDVGDDQNNQTIKEPVQEDKKSLISSNVEQTENTATNESHLRVDHEDVGAGNLNHSSSTELPKDQPPNSELSEDHPEHKKLAKDKLLSAESPEEQITIPTVKFDDKMSEEALPSSVKESGDKALVEQPSQPMVATEDVDMVPETMPLEKDESQLPDTSNSPAENGLNTGGDQKDGNKDEEDNSKEKKDDHNIDKLKRAAITTLSAAAVKSKLLANLEEDQIRELASLLIEKQLHKLETKMAFFNEIEGVTMRVKEQMDRSRQRLYQERAQIIAARLGIPASQSRAMPSSFPANRVAMNFANSVSRPPMGMNSQRPPMARPMMAFGPASSNPFGSNTMGGSSIRPPNQDKVSSVGTK